MNDQTENQNDEPKIISIDEGKVRAHLDGVVREAVEETLNKLLDAEAEKGFQKAVRAHLGA